MGCGGGGGGGWKAPLEFGQLRFFGQQEKFGQSQFLKKFARVCACCSFSFSKRDIFYFTEVSVVKSVKFTQDSGCPARDEFLVNFKENHILIYMYAFAVVLLLGTV